MGGFIAVEVDDTIRYATPRPFPSLHAHGDDGLSTFGCPSQILLSCYSRHWSFADQAHFCRCVEAVVWLWSAAMNGKGKSEACATTPLFGFALRRFGQNTNVWCRSTAPSDVQTKARGDVFVDGQKKSQ